MRVHTRAAHKENKKQKPPNLQSGQHFEGMGYVFQASNNNERCRIFFSSQVELDTNS